MIGIFQTKITWLVRNPWMFILMTVTSIGFAFIIGGFNSFDQIKVPVVMDEKVTDAKEVISIIEKDSMFGLEKMSFEEMEKRINSGKSEFGLKMIEGDYEIIVGVDSANITLVEQTVETAYMKQAQISVLKTANANIEKELVEKPAFHIETTSFHGNDSFIYNGQLQTLFGSTLFFVIYTIAYSVLQILVEKRTGIWDRVIMSPVRKWEMYVANFLYSFLIGYVQIIIVFFVFRFIIKVDFNGTFLLTLLVLIPYVLAIVSLSTFITGIVRTVQQFNAIVPLVAVSMAMIGGAFWPLEIVESSFMLALLKIV